MGRRVHRFRRCFQTDQDKTIRSAFGYRIIAVVGLSRDPTKASYRVAEYLKKNGYRIIPVNPFVDEVLEEKCYRSLFDIPDEVQKSIEVVDIFRPSDDVPSIVEQAIKLRERYGRLRVVWMQLGIVNEEAAERAAEAGLEVVMDRCMMVEHNRLKKYL